MAYTSAEFHQDAMTGEKEISSSSDRTAVASHGPIHAMLAWIKLGRLISQKARAHCQEMRVRRLAIFRLRGLSPHLLGDIGLSDPRVTTDSAQRPDRLSMSNLPMRSSYTSRF